MSRLILYLPLWPAFFLLTAACRSSRPTGVFEPKNTPEAPVYADLANWAAHPEKTDAADQTPCPDMPDRQQTAGVDVFFLYPTSYYGLRRKPVNWNASTDDTAVNARTDSAAILHQATIFNQVGRVYAPRYRQAHLNAFFSRDKKSAEQALEVAYTDASAAFGHYMRYWNKGRPFIIAAHSQGGYLGMRLIRDFIENTPLEKQLVAAYLVGWPVKRDFFQKIQPCETPEQTGCFCSWRTWERKSGLKKAPERDVVCTNPLTWNTREGVYAPKSLNRGAILGTFCVVFPQLSDAEVHAGFLLSSKPKFPGSIFFRRKNYHIGDLNLYYYNVQENVRARVEAFLR
ncbi:MAG: DUF3089 domain-containing protein [Lewinellaceae bacterium]|nr:DUF3089 domain-containing protein [Lewinellaceae bacterium]